MSIFKFFLIKHPSKSINKSSVPQKLIEVKSSDTFDSLKEKLGITHDILFTTPDYDQFDSVKSILSLNRVKEIYVVLKSSLEEYKNRQIIFKPFRPLR